MSVTAIGSDGSESEPLEEFAVVYDPDGGFVTGGGWVIADGPTSDPGDTYPSIATDDTVNFGFNAKYRRATFAPSGQVNVQLGDLHLHSAQLDWLVVSSSGTAVLRGTATIDGGSELFPFALRVTDGAIAGGADRFEITVAAPGGSPFSIDPLYQATGDLAGGSIKIHTE